MSVAQSEIIPEETVDLVTAMGPKRFYNRELSWLQFNKRVMEESENLHHPLLERLRFLSISALNLDEFYMVRVAGLVGQIHAGVNAQSSDGLTPAEQIKKINDVVADLADQQQSNWAFLKTEMAEAGIVIVDPDKLDAAEQKWIAQHFLDYIFPILTPIAIDPSHPFPFIPNKGFVLGLDCKRKDDPAQKMHSILPVPSQ